MSLSHIAQQTVAILEEGHYTTPSGRRVELRAQVEACVRGTRLYRPGDFTEAAAPSVASAEPARVEVTGEKTGEAARRLVEREGVPHVAALNFASARHPGGGFLGGARAQEEDLARCSALYASLRTQHTYYDVNRAHASLLYTDHLIYSPDVPFFRDEALQLLESPFPLSILTSPAPNAGEVLRREPDAGPAIRSTLERRAGQVLEVAARHGHRCLVLGAWGCGVFRNDPADVAAVFAGWLGNPRFAGAFERVVFAVYDRTPAQANLHAFRRQFEGWAGARGTRE